MSIIICNVNTDTFNVYNNTFAVSKVCSQCHQNKFSTEYNKNKRKSDGFRCNCKLCQSNTNKLYRDKKNNNKNVKKQINANRIYDENEVKTCSKCKQSKQITEYNKDRTNSNGLHSCCKLCESVAKTHYRNNIRQMNANRIFTENDVRTFSTCKQQKLYTEFNKSIYQKSGLDSYCKNCIANDPNTQFRQEFYKAISKTFKTQYNNYLSVMNCNSHFFKL